MTMRIGPCGGVLLAIGVCGLLGARTPAQGPPVPGAGAVAPLPGWRFPQSPTYASPLAPTISVPGVPVPHAIAPAKLTAIPLGTPAAILGSPVAATIPGAQRITIDEARQRVLGNSKLLALAAANIQGKDFAARAM